MFSTFNFFLIFSWVWGRSPISFLFAYSMDLPKTCSRPLADLWYLAPETPESPLKIFHNFMNFRKYNFFSGTFREVIAPQRRGILSSFRWHMQILSKPIRKKVGRLGLVASPKRPIFSLQLLIRFDYTILNSIKFPGADPKDFFVKSVLPPQKGLKIFSQDGIQTHTNVDKRRIRLWSQLLHTKYNLLYTFESFNVCFETF